MQRTRQSNRGNTMVEAALCLLLSLVVIIGIIDAGQILMRQQALTERLRAGCRHAIVHEFDEEEIRNVVVYGTAEPSVPAGATGLMGLEPSMVTVARVDEGSEAADRVTITIDDYPIYSFTPGFSGQFTARPLSQTITVESMGETL